MTVRRTWEIRIKNENECVASVTVPEYTQVDVSPVYERCSEIKLNPKWNGEIVMGKPSRCEMVWHRTRDVIPLTNGRCLICTKQAKHPIIAEITIFYTATGDAYAVWSRLIKGTHERIAEDDVYWWAEIPLPVDES